MYQGVILSFKAHHSQEMLDAITCWKLKKLYPNRNTNKNKDGGDHSINNKDLSSWHSFNCTRKEGEYEQKKKDRCPDLQRRKFHPTTPPPFPNVI
jgi:hypothetical protein